MIRGIIGRKLGMTQVFNKDGDMIPVTVLECGPCKVLQLKEEPMKVTLGFDEMKESRVNKARQGFFKKVNSKPMRIVKEFESTDNKDYSVGQELKADVFKPGDYVDITGTSIGKGFQGGMKRWNWSGGPGGHGSMHHRRVGSIGASADPSRVIRGMNMPGQMGNKQITTQGIRVIEVDLDKNVLVVKGSVPGHDNGFVTINRSKKKVWRDLHEVKVIVKTKVNPMKQSKSKAGAKKKGK